MWGKGRVPDQANCTRSCSAHSGYVQQVQVLVPAPELWHACIYLFICSGIAVHFGFLLTDAQEI